MKRIGLIVMICCINSFAYNQNVGIGTNTPTFPLTVVAPLMGKGIVQRTGDTEIGFFTQNGGAYLQTWTNHALQFATNNGSTQMILTPQGFLGIGTTIPSAMLDINGQVRMRGGIPGAGKVLTSDANGLASWQAPPAAAKTIRATLSTALPVPFASYENVPLKDNNLGAFADIQGFDNTNNYFEVTAASAGTYLLNAQVTWDIVNAYSGEKDYVLELRDGTTAIASNRMISEYLITFINITERSQQISSVVRLAAGQQIRMAVLQRTGVVQNIKAEPALTYLNLIRLY